VKEKAKRLGLKTVDATCPLVSKVHRRVSRLNKIGCDILVIGHRGHPEVIGTCGHAAGSVHVVSTAEEVAVLQVADPVKVGYVTQTTLSVDDCREILAAIRKKIPEINEPERTDICYATTNRQAAVRRLAKMTDLVLVVGSKNSSNSNRLRETAANYAVPAYLIDQASEIEQSWLVGKNTIGISAGASAPEHLVDEVTDYLKNLGAENIEEMDGDDEEFSFHPPNLN
jgi:4-hydroxy-3-methylbut-2-enyl diphosphate reductase